MTQLGTKKSRRGCSHCKRRRVKCDERVPCSNCSRRGETCSLLFPPLVDRASSGGSAHDSTDWLQDLELMHHWSRSTSHSQLGGGTQSHLVWGEFVPREAVKHAFLMHALLATASLHIASEAPTEALKEKYLGLSDKHQSIALDLSRTVMTNINEDSSAALFAFSSVTGLSYISRTVLQAQDMPEPRSISIQEMAKCLSLTRGVREVVAASIQAVLQSPLQALISSYRVQANVRVQLPTPLSEQISILQQMLTDHCPDQEQYKLCNTALLCLQQMWRNMFYFIQRDCLEVGHIWGWTALIDTGFIQLVQNYHQPALVITSTFIVCCQYVRRQWVIQDFGSYCFAGMSAAVSEEFQHYLNWPRDQLATDLADFKRGDAVVEYLEHKCEGQENPEEQIYNLLVMG